MYHFTSCQQCRRVSSPVLGIAILINCCEHVVLSFCLLTCILLITDEVEHFFMLIGHLDILFCIVPVQVFSPLKKNSLAFLILLISRSYLQIMDTSPPVKYTHCKYLAPLCALFLLIVCFDECKS